MAKQVQVGPRGGKKLDPDPKERQGLHCEKSYCFPRPQPGRH